MTEIWVVKITKSDSNRSWMSKGKYYITNKNVFHDSLNRYDFEYEIVHKQKAEHGMFSYPHYSDSLLHLINRQKGAIKTAITSYNRIHIRKKMVKALNKLRDEEIMERTK